MEVVKISVNKLDTLAQTVSEKSGEELPLTLDEMNTAVANIQTGGGGGTMQEKSVSYTPTENVQSDVVTPSTGYDGLSKVNVSIGAIDSEYVGSDVPRKSSADLTASGGTVSVPSGFYENNASKAVQTGTEGTPTATKGTVNNHAIAVTPSVTNAEGYIEGGTKTGTAVSVSASEVTSGNKSITSNGNNIDVVNYATVSVNVPSQGVTLQTKAKTYTPTESQQTDTITADTGYDGLNEVDVTVNAISSTYVGSGIARKSSSDLTASGATVTAPAGYYTSSASKAVASGTAGTPTATKGTVSNHAVSVTPSVTNTTGYITGSTKTGTAVTVSASELVSGNKAISSNGTDIDVTNYSTVSVNVASVSDSFVIPLTLDTSGATHYSTIDTSQVTAEQIISAYTTGKKIVAYSEEDSCYYPVKVYENGSNAYRAVVVDTYDLEADEAKSVYISLCDITTSITKNGTLSATYFVPSGSETKTQNGTYDVTNLAQLIVNVSGGGSSGLEYETGTWTPTADTADAWVDLSKTYTTPPFFYQIWDDTGTYDNTQYVNYSIAYFQGDRVFNNGLRKSSSSSSGYQYGWCYGYYRGTSSSSLSSFTLSINYAKSNTSTTGANYPRYWATESKIRASTNYASRVWKSTRTYKYIAIWAPTA